MSTLSSHDGFISRIGAGYSALEIIDGETAATTSSLLPSCAFTMQAGPVLKAFPSLAGGNTAYVVTRMSLFGTTAEQNYIVARVINLGSLNISTPTFTDGDPMPTVTELGVSRVMASAVIVEVTTILNSNPGSITITYTDQDGNTGQTSSSQALTASAAVGTCGFISLLAGDTGVRDITAASRTGGTTPTGVVKFWGLVPLGIIQIPLTTITEVRSFEGPHYFNPVRHGAGDQIKLFNMGSAVAKRATGVYSIVAQD